jgi:4-hydroxy-tetrahydrodipicolinate synthase
MKDGFYTALGTPTTDNGDFVESSFKRQVEDQIAAGASGLLALGSMGAQPYVKDSEHRKVAAATVEATKGRIPVMVGVMDNGIGRVMDRIKALEGLKIDGVVATTPYYYFCTPDELVTYFKTIAATSPFPLYLYDLPTVTKTKITVATVETLMAVDNIKGIKTGDLLTARDLMRSPANRPDFDILFSGLDLFDVAYQWGLTMNLDGMFCMTAKLTEKLFKSLKVGDWANAALYQDQIVNLRKTMGAGPGVFISFTHAMNWLGYEGIWCPDYIAKTPCSSLDKVKAMMAEYGLL